MKNSIIASCAAALFLAACGGGASLNPYAEMEAGELESVMFEALEAHDADLATLVTRSEDMAPDVYAAAYSAMETVYREQGGQGLGPAYARIKASAVGHYHGRILELSNQGMRDHLQLHVRAFTVVEQIGEALSALGPDPADRQCKRLLQTGETEMIAGMDMLREAVQSVEDQYLALYARDEWSGGRTMSEADFDVHLGTALDLFIEEVGADDADRFLQMLNGEDVDHAGACSLSRAFHLSLWNADPRQGPYFLRAYWGGE